MKTVGQIVKNREIYSVNPGQTVFEAVRTMVEKKVGAIGVVDSGNLVGIFSERDLMKRVVAPGMDPKKVLISEVMTSNPVTIEGEETYDLCLQKMHQINSRHMPVCEKGKLIGMVSVRDLLNEHLIQKEDEIKMMSAYIQDVPPSRTP